MLVGTWVFACYWMPTCHTDCTHGHRHASIMLNVERTSYYIHIPPCQITYKDVLGEKNKYMICCITHPPHVDPNRIIKSEYCADRDPFITTTLRYNHHNRERAVLAIQYTFQHHRIRDALPFALRRDLVLRRDPRISHYENRKQK